MQSGKLRHRITIQQFTSVPDGSGGYTEDWIDLRTVWAQVQPIKGYERIQSKQLETEISHRITTRFFDDIISKMRVVWRGRTMDIDSVINVDGLDKQLEILCTETE